MTFDGTCDKTIVINIIMIVLFCCYVWSNSWWSQLEQDITRYLKRKLRQITSCCLYRKKMRKCVLSVALFVISCSLIKIALQSVQKTREVSFLKCVPFHPPKRKVEQSYFISNRVKLLSGNVISRNVCYEIVVAKFHYFHTLCDKVWNFQDSSAPEDFYVKSI